MDVLDNELLCFWKALNNNNVRYIMVGGFATRFHGYNRNADDLDIWLKDDLQNRKNLRIAFDDQVDVIYLEKIKKLLEADDQNKA
jgi:hypothetical protein